MLFRPAQQLEVISTGLLALGIICTVPIMSRWKKLVLWQKLPLQNTKGAPLFLAPAGKR